MSELMVGYEDSAIAEARGFPVGFNPFTPGLNATIWRYPVYPGDLVLCPDDLYWEVIYCDMGKGTCTIKAVYHDESQYCFGVPFADLRVVGHKG